MTADEAIRKVYLDLCDRFRKLTAERDAALAALDAATTEVFNTHSHYQDAADAEWSGKYESALARIRELEQAIIERQTTIDLAAHWAGIGAAAERAAVVADMRANRFESVDRLANRYEAGAHLRSTEGEQ